MFKLYHLKKMKVFFRVLLSASMVVILASCIRMVYISKRIDPEIILGKSKHDIVFVDLFDYTQPANVFVETQCIHTMQV